MDDNDANYDADDDVNTVFDIVIVADVKCRLVLIFKIFVLHYWKPLKHAMQQIQIFALGF